MLLNSPSTPLTSLFHSPLSHLFLRISYRFLSSNHMARIVNSGTDSSTLKATADSPFSQDPVVAGGPLADTSQYNEGFIMFGSISAPLPKKNVKNYALPRSPSFKPCAVKYSDSESMCSSNTLTSPTIDTNVFDHKKLKRISRIVLRLEQASGHNCSVPSPHFENSALPPTETYSKANLTAPHDESPQGTWKKKSASVNSSRPYNGPNNSNNAGFGHNLDSLQRKSTSVHNSRPYNSPNNSNNARFGHNFDPLKRKSASVSNSLPYNSPNTSNYAGVGHNLDSWKKNDLIFNNRLFNSPNNLNYAGVGHEYDDSVNTPKFKPYDICFRGRRNPAFIGPTLLSENRERYIEMQEERTKDVALRPGMFLLKNYITHDEQVEIVKVCRELGLGSGGFYQPGYANGAKLRLKMMCLGMDWDPQTYKYGKKRLIDGSVPPSIPNYFSNLVQRAIQHAHSLIKKENRVWNVEDELPSMTPDICIVNFYTKDGKLGLHQDRDESRDSLRKGLPVVSFSIGDSAEFLYGGERDVKNAESVFLESGDVLIFGGESRHVFHGVSSVLPNSAPKELIRDTLLCPGRLNLTFRQY